MMRNKEENRAKSIKHTAELILASLYGNPELEKVYDEICEGGLTVEELAVDKALKLEKALNEVFGK